jgi:threonine/homoserine/homoserine lactone efflux protein
MDTGTVVAFLAVDLLLVFTPGADWAYAIAAGLRGRSVVPAVIGLVAGYAGHTLLAVAGLVVLVARSASLLTVLSVLGAGYLVWLDWAVLARSASPRAATEAMAFSPWQIMLKGAGVSGLNPKAPLLYFSLLPQFDPPRETKGRS